MNFFKIKNWSLAAKLDSLMGFGVIIVFFVLGYFIVHAEITSIKKNVDETMREELYSLNKFVDITEKNIQSEVNSALNMADYIFRQQGKLEQTDKFIDFVAENQITHEKKKIKVRQWLLGGEQVQYHYKVVDKIQKLSNQTATIFQRIPDGFLRISTNVRKNNGSRAVGTFIPNDSPVIQTILKGQVYRGRAWVVNAWYNTAYKPIYSGGKIIGILYVGIKQRDIELFREYFHSRKYFKTGYPYIIDTTGVLIVHPNLEGKSAGKSNLFHRMKKYIGDTTHVHRMEYIWPETDKGKPKVQYVIYNSKLNNFIAATYYKNKIFNNIKNTKRLIIIFTVLALIFTLTSIYIIVKNITNKIKQTMKVTKAVSEGDLTAELSFKSKDELYELLESLLKLKDKLKNYVVNLKEQSDNLNETGMRLTEVGEELAQSSEEQASSVEEFTANLEHVSENISLNNTETQKATEKVNSAAKRIKGVREAIINANSAMEKISEKIKLVTDIASKTDILAINAAIEASKAGDAGRGFSVIANEIRELSEKSKQAAAEIIETVENGLITEKKALEEQDASLPDFFKSVEIMNSVSERSIEIDQVLIQISSSINQLNAEAQRMSSRAENLQDTAKELAEQSSKILQQISVWKIK